MRFFKLLVLFNFIYSLGNSQMVSGDKTLFGNEWIQDDKTYFKISILKDGIYRVSYQELVKAGVSVDGVKGLHFFMINLGAEVPLFVSTSDHFSNEDYILFYGKKNRGELDQYLYQDPQKDQLNSDYSLYTDENTYFLSWNKSENNKRIKLKENEYDASNLPFLERFYQHVDKKVFSDLHFKPTHNGRDFIRYSSYDKGEGYGSEVNNLTQIHFHLDKIYYQGSHPKIHARYTGNASNHFIETNIGDLILNKFASNGYGVNDFEETFDSKHLANDLAVEIFGTKSDKDRHSLASITLTYAREYDFRGLSEFYFELGPSFIPRYLEIENFDYGSSPPILFRHRES